MDNTMPKQLLKKLVIASFLMPYHFAFAYFVDGNNLYTNLADWKSADTKRVYDATYAAGYVIGVSDAFTRTIICPPNNVTRGQIIDITFLYLQNNPNIRQLPASVLVMNALKEAFPCKN